MWPEAVLEHARLIDAVERGDGDTERRRTSRALSHWADETPVGKGHCG